MKIAAFWNIALPTKMSSSMKSMPELILGSYFICILMHYFIKWSRASSGSIVSDYGLDDQAIGVRFPAGAKDFSCSLYVHTGSEAHPASCTMGTGGPFRGGPFPGGKKRGRGVTLTTHPHLVPRSRMSRSYTSSPPKRLHGV
jgi:hypothetical protein